jgi:KDO2-lipid IV(A) lauroyltransferase
MSVERASVLGEKLAAVLGPRLPKKNGIIRRNLERVFPEKNPDEIETLTRGVWQSFGQVLAEYAHLKTFAGTDSKTGRMPRVEVVGVSEPLRRADGPSVFVSAHLANWELAAAPAKALGIPLSVVYTPEQNWLVQGMIQNKRRVLGCECIPSTDGLLSLARALSKGRSLGFVMDRRLKQGEPLPFFGSDTFMSTFPARLALKFGCDLVPVRVERLQRGAYRVTVCEPVRPDPSIPDDRTKAVDMTRRVSEHFESWIRERPDQWFCSKRMWPKPAKRAQ